MRMGFLSLFLSVSLFAGEKTAKQAAQWNKSHQNLAQPMCRSCQQNYKMPLPSCQPNRYQVLAGAYGKDLQIMLQMREQRPGGYGSSQKGN